MEVTETTEFSGVVGQVLQRAVSTVSLISGLVLALILIVGNWALLQAGLPRLVTPFSQIIFTMAMARFAVNGMYGEWSGTVFSTIGGSWAQVGTVAARFLVMTAIWLIPLTLFASVDQETLGMMAAQELVQQQAQSVDIRSRCRPTALHHFRAGIGRCHRRM